ncbi:hypothetical protein N7490_009995 [Penicillium lividum]|nr:hypothetical protein N7490_009995 [Penicillium lividum]
MRTHSSHKSVTFNLIYDRTTLSLVNNGLDITFHSNDKAYGWGIPYTTSTPNDRKWGGEFYNNWTSFHFHMLGRFELSIWAGDGGGIPKERLATIRDVRGSLKLVGLSWTPLERTWYSSKQNYPLSWTVHIPGYVATLSIVGVVENQLLLDSTGLETVYEGFVTFSGDFLDNSVEGYGLVEKLQ